MAGDLSGKTVLITGAARGLGAETALRVAARGGRVALVGLEPDGLAEVAGRCGADAAWWEADVTDPAAIEAAANAAAERFGAIDAAVVNAGIAAGGPLRLADPESFDRVIEVNLLGSVRTMRAVIPHLMESRGYLLQIASVAALVATPGLAAYCASKSGVEAVSRALRGELMFHGVDVGCAYLIWHDTEMVRGSDRLPGMGRGRQSLPWPLSKSHPVGDGAELIVEGIEKRARTVAAPRWTKAFLPLRGLIGPLTERLGSREVPEIERAITEHGAAELTKPVGAGGAADSNRSGAAAEVGSGR